MSIIKMYGLFLRHFYLITRSFPRVLDLIYWPSIQITLWGFISNFLTACINPTLPSDIISFRGKPYPL